MYRISRTTIYGIAAALLMALSWRLLLAVIAAQNQNLAPLEIYAFTALFPAIGAVFVLSLPPARTREGVLMQVGTVLQMLLIIAVQPFALHLLLGLPVVFLVVEIFMRHMPHWFRNPILTLIVVAHER